MGTPLQAGRLNSLVIIQSRSAGQDATGQPLTTWVDHATVWAHIRYSGGLEAIKADAVASIAQASVRIRYRAGLTAGMRLLHGATVYEISAVLPDEAGRQWTDLVCQVVAA